MKYLTLCIFTLSLFACEKQRDIKKEILVIHDEVMPQTGYLMNLRGSLQALTKTDSTKKQTLAPTIDSLKLAHDQMMEWMQGYDASHDMSDTTYFIKQKEKVTVVNKLYITVISSAEQKIKQ